MKTEDPIWPVHCGQKVAIDLEAEGGPVGVCQVCGETFPVEVAEDPERGYEITLADLLVDAARVLHDTGKPALARAVTMARETNEGGPLGEAWLRDVVEALDAGDRVIEAARTNPDHVVLDELAEAIDRCASWGLKAGDRTRNGLRSTVIALLELDSLLKADTMQPKARLAMASESVSRLLEALGFGTPEGGDQ